MQKLRENGFELKHSYDFDDEEWRWGATEDTALEVVTFYKKMIRIKQTNLWDKGAFNMPDIRNLLPFLKGRSVYIQTHNFPDQEE